MQTKSKSVFFLRPAMVFLTTALLIMFFGRGFIDPDEGRYAEVPREMVASGNWLEMRLMGYRYYEKPPLAYWLTAPSIAVFGARDWATRIPLMINLVLISLMCAGIMRKRWAPDQANLALMVTCSSVGFIAGLSLLMTDPFLTLWFFLTCWLAYEWFDTPPAAVGRRAGLALGAGLTAGLGFMTKGAVAVVLPAGILGLWIIWEWRWRDLRWSLPLWSGAGLLLLSGLGLLILEKHNPGFFKHFIIEEHLARFTGTRAIQGHPKPMWFFVQIVPLFLLPWTLFIFRAIRFIFIRKVLKTDSLSRFLLVWAGVVLIFFSISTGKLMSYILPALPPLALLLGRWGLAEPFDGTPADRRLIKLGTAGCLLMLTAVAGVWLISLLGLLPGDIPQVRKISVLAFIPLLLTLPALRRLSSANFPPRLALVNSAGLLAVALMLTPLPGRAFNVFAHQNSSQAYQELAEHLRPEDRVVVIWAYRTSLPFYTQRIYRPFQDRNELVYGMRLEPDRPPEMQHPDEIRQLVKATEGRVFAVIEPDYYPEKWQQLKIPYRHTDLKGDSKTIFLELLK